jgi:ribosomal protein RSM22 (predicted rRNA methylase)
MWCGTRVPLCRAAYSLSVLTPGGADAAVRSMWARTAPGGVLALIEPASSRGFSAILRARELLVPPTDSAQKVDSELTGETLWSDEPIDVDAFDALMADEGDAPVPDAGFETKEVMRASGGRTQGAGGFAAAERVDGVYAREHAPGLIVAPCPHAGRCPLAPGATILPWGRADRRPQAATCHVTQRVVESEARRYLERERRRGAQKREVREAFSYLLLRKPALHELQHHDAAGMTATQDNNSMWARVLRNPRKRRQHVLLDVCLPSGKASSEVATKRKLSRSAYRQARKTRQGDAWTLSIS